MAAGSEPLLPLRAGEGEAEAAAGEGGPLRAWAVWLALLLADAAASCAFWYALLYAPDRALELGAGAVLGLMLCWRLWRARGGREGPAEQLPYSCGFAAAGGKELFLVATVHISPRAPQDVRAVMSAAKPDIALIELDDERLDRLRDAELQKAREPQPQDLQPVRLLQGPAAAPETVRAQRALWNAERSGETIAGSVVFDAEDEYGIGRAGDLRRGKIALVRRGGPAGELAPFAVKAHIAAGAGAQAVLVINSGDRLPVQRLGSSSLWADLRVAFRTRSCGFPSIPVLLLPKAEGERLREQCLAAGAEAVASPEEGVATAPRAEFEIIADSYPRRTLPRRLCQGAALAFSGIGVLYGIIQCFDVEVGAEFTEAEAAATAQGIPCACIDVDMNRFWGRLGAAVLPTPRNLADSLRSWLAFPRALTRTLFPPRANVDVLGSMVLHLASFPARTWLAFVIAGAGASTVASYVLQLLGCVSERGAEEAGAVSKGDRSAAQAYIMLLVEAYLFPQVYQAVAASRDEAMYRSIVARSRERQASRLVAVVGAGHANGILQRARTRGL